MQLGKCSPSLARGAVTGTENWLPDCILKRDAPPTSDAQTSTSLPSDFLHCSLARPPTSFSGIMAHVPGSTCVYSTCFRLHGQSLRPVGSGVGTDRDGGRSRSGSRGHSRRGFVGICVLPETRSLVRVGAFAGTRGLVRSRTPPGVQGFGRAAAAGPSWTGDGAAGDGDLGCRAGGGHARRAAGCRG